MAKQNTTSDVEFIRELAELLKQNDLTEIEVNREYGNADRLKVRVSRANKVIAAPAVAAPVAVAPAAQVGAPAAIGEPEADPASLPGAVTSPMVGTVYLQPGPDSEPFVKVGDTVSEGDTLLIVEAMKTMNHIPAPASGTVRRILVADGDPVEFGAPLMIVE